MDIESIGLLEFQKRFSEEEACLDHLFRLRWPEGFICPRCGGDRFSFISTRRLYQCGSCRYQASVTAGTVFHKTRTPIRKWFWMIFLMTRQKSGVSILSMQRMLEIGGYKTAWLMGHKIRKAMEDRDSKYKLAGLVEMDDAFIGSGKARRRGKGGEDKTRFVVGMERRGDKAGFCAMRQVERVDSESIGSMVKEKVEPRSAIRTKDREAYRKLGTEGYDHGRLSSTKNKDGRKKLHWVHASIANIKGNIRGVHHGVSKKHLQRYLSEFCYRFNRRIWETQLFGRGLAACLSTRAVTWDEVTA